MAWIFLHETFSLFLELTIEFYNWIGNGAITSPGNPTSSVNIKDPVIFKQPVRTESKGSWQVASDTCVALLPRVAVLHDAAEYEDDITPSITAKVGASVIWERSTLLRYVHFTQDRLSPKTKDIVSTTKLRLST